MSREIWYQGDNQTLEVTFTDEGQPIDLADGTPVLIWQINRGTVMTDTMTIVAPTADGKATYTFGAGELEAGELRYRYQFVETASGNVVTTGEERTIDVVGEAA